jgi:hypothetical protein
MVPRRPSPSNMQSLAHPDEIAMWPSEVTGAQEPTETRLTDSLRQVSTSFRWPALPVTARTSEADLSEETRIRLQFREAERLRRLEREQRGD